VLGICIPFVLYGIFASSAIWDFATLLLIGAFLTFIFVALSFNIGLAFTDKIKGFGFSILLWLFLAVIYDGLFLLSLLVFNDYPLDKFALGATLFNPIDLSRIMILLKLDISALLGYTGAVFQKFFGTFVGMSVSFTLLAVWVLVPVGVMLRQIRKKDF